MKKLFIFLCSITVSLVLLIFFYFFLWDFWADFNTTYTKNFSNIKFNGIEKGMDKSQVKNILGEPFEVYKPGDECWQYSKAKGIGGGYLDWNSARVCFGNNGKVSWVGKNTFM